MKSFEIIDGKGIIKIGFDNYTHSEHLSIFNPIVFLSKIDTYDYSELSLLPLGSTDTFSLLNNSLKLDFYKDYTNKEDELHHLLEPFLSLFTNGKYNISFVEKFDLPCVFTYKRPSEEYIKNKVKDFEQNFLNNKIRNFNNNKCIIYDFDDELISIKTNSEINTEKVFFYENQIKEGKRPFIIVFSGTEFFSYVLDGHHKLVAYQNLRIQPPCVLINTCPKSLSDIRFNIEYLTLNYDPNIFQKWNRKKAFLEENPNSVLRKFVKNGIFNVYNSYSYQSSTGNYINDLPDGEHKSWHHNGKLQSICNYEKGQEVGKWIYYDQNGQISHEKDYNKFHNKISDKFFLEGRQMHENQWNYDEIGNLLTFRHFDEFHNLINETNYENNTPIISKSYERDGEINRLEKFDIQQQKLILISLDEHLIFEHSTEKYKDQKRRLKDWHEKYEEKIEKFKEYEEFKKKVDDEIETLDFMRNIKIIAVIIILIILIYILI